MTQTTTSPSESSLLLPPWDRFETSTKPFRNLYNLVTDELRTYAAALPGGERGSDYIWFKYLIDGFEAEYQKWPTSPHIRPYLTRVDQLKKASRLVLYAYLHIAYDLPRVLADSFSEPHIPGRLRCKEIFATANYIFTEAFDVCSRSWSTFGVNSIPPTILKALNRSWFTSFAQAFGSWPIMLRNEAWDLAQRLAAAGDRQIMEEKLWRFIDWHTRTTLQHTKGARRIVTLLSPPRVCVVPPALAFFFSGWFSYLILGFIVLTVIGGLILILINYWGLLHISDSVGREFYRGMRSIRANLSEGLTRGGSEEEEVLTFCVNDEIIQISRIESLAVKLKNLSEPKTFDPVETIDLETYDEETGTEGRYK